jgi:hypothetical protein
MGWLVGIGGCEDTELLLKLKIGILQSNNDFVGIFPKDWDMSACYGDTEIQSYFGYAKCFT